MEEKNRKVFSTILLAVGVLFIVVSGGIFVSKTWQYLPEAVKKLCLVAVTAGFFVGAHFAEKNSLRKAATALYYLGVCFTGFSVVALVSVMEMGRSMELLLAMLGMSAPVLARFIRERKVIDLLLQVFLCDGMILCVARLDQMGSGDPVALICLSTFTTILAALLYYCKNYLAERELMVTIAGVAYGLHVMISLPYTIAALSHYGEFFFSAFPILTLTGSVTVVYLAWKENVILRICQSLALLYGALAVSVYVFRNAFHPYAYPEFTTTVFAAFVIGVILTVALDRMELWIVSAGFSFLFSFVQVLEYVVMSADSKQKMLCHPYGICACIALLAWKYLRDPDVEWRVIGKASLLYGLLNVNGLLAFLGKDYGARYGLSFCFCIALLMIATWLEKARGMEALNAALQTMALFFGLMALIAHPVIGTTILNAAKDRQIANVRTEYICIFLGLGIVLLGIIWYDIFEKIRIFQFIGTCLLLAALVLHNLAVPALPNVLFLGMGTLTMLIVATLLKKRDYAFASAITLILVVLYLTREVWMSIAWWVYLFVAGVGLVIFAIKKEKAEK